MDMVFSKSLIVQEGLSKNLGSQRVPMDLGVKLIKFNGELMSNSPSSAIN
jgi:hypothetical protein